MQMEGSLACLGNRYQSALLRCLHSSARADLFDFRVAFSSSIAGSTIVHTFAGSLQHSDNSRGLPAHLTMSWAREH